MIQLPQLRYMFYMWLQWISDVRSLLFMHSIYIFIYQRDNSYYFYCNAKYYLRIYCASADAQGHRGDFFSRHRSKNSFTYKLIDDRKGRANAVKFILR